MIVTVLTSACLIFTARWFSQASWKSATEEGIAQVISPALKTPVRPSLDEIDRNNKLSRLLSAASGISYEAAPNHLGLREILTSGSAIAIDPDPGLDIFFSQSRSRFDSNVYFVPPYKGFAIEPRGYEMIAEAELSALRALQASTNLSKLRASLAGQIEADKWVSEGITRGTVNTWQARSIRQRFFTKDEIQPAVRRAVVGEFWDTDILMLLHPEKPYWGMSLRSTDEADLPGNYDALQCAREISSAYDELLLNCERPPGESTSKVETRLDLQASTLPSDGSVGQSGFKWAFERFKYRATMRMIPNSYGVGFIQASLRLNKSLDQTIRADCLAAHRLVEVKLASLLFQKERRRKPHDMQELVKAGLLREIPLDPWSHGRLIFDPRNRTVSSAGHDHSLGMDSLLVDNTTTHRYGLSFRL